MSVPNCLLVHVTCPSNVSENLGRALVEARVAACVNIVPQVQSIYRWQGKVVEETESLLLIKTTRSAYPSLERALTQLHPYELPEILVIEIDSGSEGYLAWIRDSSL